MPCIMSSGMIPRKNLFYQLSDMYIEKDQVLYSEVDTEIFDEKSKKVYQEIQYLFRFCRS